MKTSSAASTLLLMLSLAANGCSSDHGTAASHGSTSEGVPRAPTDLKVLEAAGGAHLTWKDNSDNESEFMIERKEGTESFVALKNVAADETEYHDATVTAGTSYTYRIMAMGKGGHALASGYSNEVVFTAPSVTPPIADAGQDAVSDGGGKEATDAADAADARDPHMGHM